MSARSFLYANGFFKIHHLHTPVISVGNITMGGTGKTPMVEAIARILAKRGDTPLRCAVLSRGYRGSYEGEYHVVSDGKTILSSPEESGDEPYLLAIRNPGMPVVVGKRRFDAGLFAEKAFFPDVFILDDGFQHISLARDVNILLINAEYPFGKGVFPSGTRREPLSALKRADAVIVTKTDKRELSDSEMKRIERHSKAPLFTCRYAVSEITNIITGETKPFDLFSGQKVGAFAALAQPSSFFSMLERHNIKPSKTLSLRDHGNYDKKTFSKISNALSGCDVWLTTEKDAVKINSEYHNSAVPIYVVKISHQFSQPDLFKNFIFSKLALGSRKGQ